MLPKKVVEKFWQLMRTNDFYAVGDVLADEYELIWPQSAEKIIGRSNFGAVNAAYPANGEWTFVINNLLAEGDQVVSDVTVSDGIVVARAITFSTVERGKITRQVEFWPDDYPAPEWRKQWVVPLEGDKQ